MPVTAIRADFDVLRFLSPRKLNETALSIIGTGANSSRLSKIIEFTPYGSDWYSKIEFYDRASFVEMLEETKDLTDVEFAEWCEKERENFESFEDECMQLHHFKIHMEECEKKEKVDAKRAIGVQRRKE